jgi:hypothetical protein
MSDLSVIDGVGFGAAGLVLATFCMRSMNALRWVAIASNVAFIAYGYLGGLAPVLLLHTLLLPVNIHRLLQLRSAHVRSDPTAERTKGGRDSERHYAERSSDEYGARVQMPAGIEAVCSPGARFLRASVTRGALSIQFDLKATRF